MNLLKSATSRTAFVRQWTGFTVALVLSCALSQVRGAETHWVTTWGCGPQLTEPRNLPPAPLANSTLRQFVPITIGGKQLRVRFSNAYGTNAVILNAAHIAIATGKGSAGDGEIDPDTDKALTFHGTASATIEPGEAVLCDPVKFNLPALTNLAITIHFGDISAKTINGHPGSRTTSFIKPGDVVSAPEMSGAVKMEHWYIITGVEVMADDSSQAIVVLGDSITDGRGSTTDGNDRWPDALARRLATNAPTAEVAVVNMGIGGNTILHGGLGPTVRARFDRDVLGQSGVRWLIVFEGVNDIGGSRNQIVATNLISAYQEFIEQAHAHDLKIYGATITPFGTSFYDRGGHEAARQSVNDWIRNSGKFDAVIDFDAKVRDPANPRKLLPAYDSGDHLHLNPAGYRAMAEAVPLKLFASPSTAPTTTNEHE